MLFQKLLKPANAATGIQYVGAATGQGFTSGGTVTVSLTGLTGGISSSAQIGDIVVISIGVAGSTNAPAIPTVSGYTQAATAGANDTNATRIYTGYKVLTSADTSVSYTWVASNGSSAAYVSVWRNVDATYPLDITTQFIGTQNTVLANPLAITPVTLGAYIIAAAAGANSAAGNAIYSSSDLTDFRTASEGSTYDLSIGGGYKQWTSGAFNPAAFTFSAGDSSTYSNASTTLALRPTGKTNPSFINSASGFASTVTVPSHNAGDWLVFVSGNQTTTPPTLVSGFTNIGTFVNTGSGLLRSGRLQYIVSDGTITTINGGGNYANVAVLRNVTGIGVTKFVNTAVTTGSTTVSVSLTPTIPGAICLLGSYNGGSLTSTSGITFTNDFGGRSTTSAISASISGSLTFGFAVATCYFGAEFY